MAILATIFGIIALAFTLSVSCVAMPNVLLKSVAVLYLIASLCMILTLVAKADCDSTVGGSCACGPGCAVAIVASIMYFAMAVIVYKIPPYDGHLGDGDAEPRLSGPVPEQAAPGTTMTTVTTLSDGSKKTVKTTIDANGNKTIEETIEYPVPEPTEPEVVTSILPDGSIKTTRTYIDEDGAKVIEETIEEIDKSVEESAA